MALCRSQTWSVSSCGLFSQVFSEKIALVLVLLDIVVVAHLAWKLLVVNVAVTFGLGWARWLYRMSMETEVVFQWPQLGKNSSQWQFKVKIRCAFLFLAKQITFRACGGKWYLANLSFFEAYQAECCDGHCTSPCGGGLSGRVKWAKRYTLSVCFTDNVQCCFLLYSFTSKPAPKHSVGLNY